MAEHGAPEYATAQGNDYLSHEGTYRGFVHLVFIGIVHVVNILLGLTVGGVNEHWLVAAAIFFIATVAAVQGFLSGGRTSSYVALVISLLALAVTSGS
ncbi:MAG TPA: aa3-type cytochrome c oxidase subunit IV [Xanthobacteraceae bacterium]|nr:aa3-type cytochrome c oxidase subunit IV [Xanthobacteraceae bacterium]